MASHTSPQLNGMASPDIVAPPLPATERKSARSPEQPPVKDAVREIVETVVFVIVLVLLLKTFVAEAFVIPTGSMAETLLGYQKWVTCPQCKYQFPVNCSSEVDPQDGMRIELLACTCPNCRWREVWKDPQGKKYSEPPGWGSGDRVLVSKFPFDNNWLEQPKRFNVVVFKYPVDPQKNQTPMNYIKRLIGLFGETIAISEGDVYMSNAVQYPKDNHPQAERPEDWWKPEFMYVNDKEAIAAWNRGEFKILQKPPSEMLTLRRIVFDNDYQAADLVGKSKPRWQFNGKGWTADNLGTPKVFKTDGGSGADVDWLRYQHLLVDRGTTDPNPQAIDPRPQLIRNSMGYNSGKGNGFDRGDGFWVGDLMLECTTQVDAAVGELVLELSKSGERFQARFDLATGDCTLMRSGDAKPLGKKEKVLSPGKHTLRFADFDNRLTLWVDDKLPFGDGVNYPAVPPQQDNPNNLEPASVGIRGGAKLSVSHIQLWRDTYYTHNRQDHGVVDGVQTYYVQPGHYLCLGDNSAESSDSRFWGLVPERLLLGRALMVYFPFSRMGVIR